jgi:hypothetical protein
VVILQLRLRKLLPESILLLLAFRFHRRVVPHSRGEAVGDGLDVRRGGLEKCANPAEEFGI